VHFYLINNVHKCFPFILFSSCACFKIRLKKVKPLLLVEMVLSFSAWFSEIAMFLSEFLENYQTYANNIKLFSNNLKFIIACIFHI
jgi:hypothetical protein